MDLTPLMRLKDALQGAQRNTKRMVSRLDRCESRLSVIEGKMRPIQAATDRYYRAKENIRLTLVEVGKTYEYFRIASDVRPIINAGLTFESRDAFFEAISKLSMAKKFFKDNREIKSSGTVLKNINALLKVRYCTPLHRGPCRN
jgi:hypothetical protein